MTEANEDLTTRERILNASEALFAELGFDGVTAAVSAFGLEADHSAGAAATSLRDLAAAGADWDFAWLLPARGADHACGALGGCRRH